MDENYAIEMQGITKIFGGNIIANNNINLKIKKGEIHALLGENGAGKTTLMSILFGLYKPTYGTIKIFGKDVSIENASVAKDLGIGMVHQHFKLVENFKVWENIALSKQSERKKLIAKKDIFNKIQKIMDKYNLHIDLNKKVSQLLVGDLQKIEIIKILFNDAKILVFDEPTAVLLQNEIKHFFEIIRNLKKEGKTIIFISHKLYEIKELADNVSVLRAGMLIDTFAINAKSTTEIATLMVGRQIVEEKNNHQYISDKTILSVENLNVKKDKIFYVKDFNLEVKAGEIVALAGVDGNGQNELLDTIVGLNTHFDGTIKVNNKIINNIAIHKRYKEISYIPEDRHKNAIVLEFSVLDNILLQNLYTEPFVNKAGLLNRNSNVYYSQQLINEYDIKGTANGYAPISYLSGGNQQKLIVGREIKKQHKLLIVSNPTRGVDVGAIEYIHKQILKEKQKNNAILLASTELDEVIALADRVVVISAGKKVGELNHKDISKEKIGILMLGK